MQPYALLVLSYVRNHQPFMHYRPSCHARSQPWLGYKKDCSYTWLLSTPQAGCWMREQAITDMR